MLIAGGKCFGLCNIRWKISQLFSALFLEILCMRNYAACLWWLDELYDIYIWKLLMSNDFGSHLTCWPRAVRRLFICSVKIAIYLKKMKGALRLKGWNWGGHYLIAKTSSFLKEHSQPLGWRGDQALQQSSIEFCLGQIQRPNCLSLPSKTYSEPEIK